MGAYPDPGRRRLITASIMLAALTQALDVTIANVAMPHMQGSLMASQDQITWVLTSYIIAAAIATPVTGWLAGRFGRKRLMMAAVIGFTVASALCGMAENISEIVAFRLAQGLFGAPIMPLTQAILLDINPPQRHGGAMAILGVGTMAGPVFGPALGGWLTEDYNWRWVFFINLPIGLLALAGIMAFLGETREEKGHPFDFFGFTTLSLGFGALQLMLDRGAIKDWFSSPEIQVEAAVAGLCLYLFGVHMATAKRPFINPALFKDRNFVLGNALVFSLGLLLFSVMALLPPLLQGLMNIPAITSGFATAPRGVGTMISMLVGSWLIGKIDHRVMLVTGFCLNALSLWMMTGFSLEMDLHLIVVSGFIQGLGIGQVWVPMAAIAFGTLDPAFRNEAAGVFSLVRNLGSSIGISIFQSLVTRNIQVAHASLASHIVPNNPLLRLPGNLDAMTQEGLAMIDGLINRQAAMIAYLDDYKLMLVMSICFMPFILLLRGTRQKPDAASLALE